MNIKCVFVICGQNLGENTLSAKINSKKKNKC